MSAIRANLSVTCFNNNPLNMLMWSHYAQCHRGFLVEFRIPHPTLEWVYSAFLIQSVTYQNEFSNYLFSAINPINILDPKNKSQMYEFIKNQYLVKARYWQYENEFRVLAHDYDVNDFNSLLKIIPAKYLSSVILGAKLENNDPNKSSLLDAVAFFNETFEQDVKIYQAELKPNSFKIFVRDPPILDRKTKTLKDFLFPSN